MEGRLDALNVALTNELREHEFYLNNSKRTNNPVGKAMFRQIAEEELEHHERLKQLAQVWGEKEKWPATIPLQVKNTIVRDILKDVVEKSSSAAESNADDAEALRVAIDFEAKGAAFYAGLREQVTDPKEKAFFDLMAQIEQEHYTSLKETEEYFSNPAAYYQRMERGGLDGA